ncbi:MAG: response regulator transcription factor [Clostridia bacterium]|nr:response regulator transcription factor [Clostridia bacterium]
MHNILICDDEKDIVSALEIYLSTEGYGTFSAYTGKEVLSVLEKEEIHLVLLDIMMPEMDGISALSLLREKYNLPVILISAKSEDYDKVLGLNTGADDYITKPFNPMEVLARVRSQLRRYTKLGAMETKNEEEKENLFTVGDLTLNDDKKEVFLLGEEVLLTPTEFEILKLLMQNSGKVLSPKKIYETVWNQTAWGAENTVAVHIRHLREKIEIDPASPRYLKVVWGQGYKLERGV